MPIKNEGYFMKKIILFYMLFTSMIANAEYYSPLEYNISGKPSIETDKQAIDTLIAEFWAAWSSQDALAVANTHTKDAEWTNAFGRSFRGSKELEVFLRDKLFPMFDSDISVKEVGII